MAADQLTLAIPKNYMVGRRDLSQISMELIISHTLGLSGELGHCNYRTLSRYIDSQMVNSVIWELDIVTLQFSRYAQNRGPTISDLH